jgi:hypothetical protein
MQDRKQKQVYVIFSVDTEHDIVRRYATTTDDNIAVVSSR